MAQIITGTFCKYSYQIKFMNVEKIILMILTKENAQGERSTFRRLFFDKIDDNYISPCMDIYGDNTINMMVAKNIIEPISGPIFRLTPHILLQLM